MPYRIEISSEPEKLEVKYFGKVTEDEYRAAIIEFIEKKGGSKYLLVLTDCLEMNIGPSVLDVYERINMYEKLGIDTETKEAILIPADQIVVENVKFYETACLNRGYNVRIFENRKEAIEWLKLFE
ncbi:MAG TPA: STAS/SEC14 domain-containing protein [Ignavibacteria bacterium]|nr:STAS/SEC14 domain-containing protein [Ignavibacteria bacterium]